MENILRHLQLTQLEILKVFDRFCRDHGLQYSLYAGSLLGAVRHRGFIPWDDDLDVCMPRSDYDRFIALWTANPQNGYILQNKENTPGFTQSFTKLRKDHTTFLQFDWERRRYHTGIFLDIFPVDRIPGGKWSRRAFKVRCMLYQLLTREFVPTKGSKVLRLGSAVILGCIPKSVRPKLRQRLLKRLTENNADKSLDAVFIETMASLGKTYNPTLADAYVDLPFEDGEFLCFENWHEYLTGKFGDYMQLPPEEDRAWKHHPIIIDFEHNDEDNLDLCRERCFMDKHGILLIRDNECFEPRVNNHLRYFEEHEIPYHVIAWNRNGTAKPNEHITFYQRRAEYGKRIANIPNKIGWMCFVMKEVYRHRSCKAIHACDIDGILPALIVGKPLGKKVIFDIFDWISSLTGKGIVYRLVEFLQNFCYRHADAVILCEEERKAQAKASNDHVFVIPNIPDGKTEFDQETLKKTAADLERYDHVVSYVGVFDRDRGLENLLEAVSRCPNVKLNIAGFGVLEELIRDYAQQYPNIICWGRVEYGVGQAIQKNSSVIFAQYYLSNPVHKFAAPNKYYESLILGVPMITTEKTLVGSKVEKFKTGFVLDERMDSLKELLESADLGEQIAEKKQNCTEVWENHYKTYYTEYMSRKYMPFVEE